MSARSAHSPGPADDPWRPRVTVSTLAAPGPPVSSGRAIRADIPALDYRTSGAVCLAVAADPAGSRADHLTRLSRALAGGHLTPGRLSVYDLRYWLEFKRTQPPHLRHVIADALIPGYRGESPALSVSRGERASLAIEADMRSWLAGRRDYIAGVAQPDGRYEGLAIINAPRLLDGDTLSDSGAGYVGAAVPFLALAGWRVTYDGVEWIGEGDFVIDTDSGEALTGEGLTHRFHNLTRTTA